MWQEERQLIPVFFNSPFFALNLAFFVLSFCCSKADLAQQQSVSGRWLLLLMDSCLYLQNHCKWNQKIKSTANGIQKILMCFAYGVWTQVQLWKCYGRKFVPSDLSNQLQTHCSRNRNINSGLQKESCHFLQRETNDGCNMVGDILH